ncbi:DUF1934 family protein [Mycoplasmopsis lipofaciens]|uniref:DUF1934 family protein n=1 Tax=Mycoplasmopsis lipofaciens TaxID=114884 RepID=UPI0004816BEF|nr:DUF1934 family protein [Mycoplasmopsis lipofaciens]
MKIKFKSIQHQNDEKNTIEFEANAHYEKFLDNLTNINYHVYQFREPSQNIMNRIEINEKQVNIMAGDTTLNIPFGIKAANSFIKVNGQEFIIYTEMHNISIEKIKKEFSYSLYSSSHELIGKFELSIEEI